jgi:diadenosine tetraphosphatase ApaH/serine/threonine PP2A family protein phosphatase
MSSALSRAMDYWQAGRPVPRNLAAELLADGEDLPALQRFHLKVAHGRSQAPRLPEIHQPEG